MASFRKRGPYQWQAQVRKKGYPLQTKTFETKAAAQVWQTNDPSGSRTFRNHPAISLVTNADESQSGKSNLRYSDGVVGGNPGELEACCMSGFVARAIITECASSRKPSRLFRPGWRLPMKDIKP